MQALLLVDHGSRRASANAELPRLVELVERQLPGAVLVGFAHLELAEPSIETAIAALVQRGASELFVCPYLLGPGRHATEDIPRLVNDAARRYAGLQVRVAPALGCHPLLAQLVILRAREIGLGEG